MTNDVAITVNGMVVLVPRGATVAAAVARAGVTTLHKSVGGEPRAALCGMGICFECRVTVNGRAHSRSCQIPCESGMEVRTDE
jgi:sarcosine oxidase subunit alpha